MHYQTLKVKIGDQEFKLDKAVMKHILECHHSEYWNGSVKQKQTFLDKSMNIDDITNAVTDIMKQNRDILLNKGTNKMYQVEGIYNGKEFVVGVKNGLIRQFYQK